MSRANLPTRPTTACHTAPEWGNYVTDRVEEFRDGQPLKLGNYVTADNRWTAQATTATCPQTGADFLIRIAVLGLEDRTASRRQMRELRFCASV